MCVTDVYKGTLDGMPTVVLTGTPSEVHLSQEQMWSGAVGGFKNHGSVISVLRTRFPL